MKATIYGSLIDFILLDLENRKEIERKRKKGGHFICSPFFVLLSFDEGKEYSMGGPRVLNSSEGQTMDSTQVQVSGEAASF